MRKSIIIIALATLPLFDSCSLSNNTTADMLEEIKDNGINYYVCNNMGMDSEEEFQPVVYDEVEMLFEKFDVPYELQDYIRQICMIYNVDTKIAVSLMQIESWSGHHVGYNVKSEARAYYTNGKKTWDLGLFQMSDYYHNYWEDYFYNPELIMSLGYIKRNFTLEDDYISIQVGVSYLSHLYKRLGTYELALQAYNCGIGNVLKGRIPDITKQYTKAIMNNWKYREGDV